MFGLFHLRRAIRRLSSGSVSLRDDREGQAGGLSVLACVANARVPHRPTEEDPPCSSHLEKDRTRISTGGNKIGRDESMLLPFDSYFSEANVALAKLGPAAVERSLLSLNLENRAFSAERGSD